MPARSGDAMPFDPNFPFYPADPSQWWQLRNLLRPSAQPTAPPNAASGTAAQSTRIDVPEDDGLPNDWFVPEADGYPSDWFVPDAEGYAPTPAAAPRAAPPAPSPQTNAANPTTSTRPAAPFDPLAAYWAQVPASRVGAMAWHPPIFLSPDSFAPQETPSSARGGPPAAFSNPLAQFLPAASTLPDLPSGGILGGIAKMAAEATVGFERASGCIKPPEVATIPAARSGRISGREKFLQLCRERSAQSWQHDRFYRGSTGDPDNYTNHDSVSRRVRLGAKRSKRSGLRV
jgi:hypothetical protein